ncbi:hypothetical protein V1264_024006 [Littorina saxatilis]|uniref:Copper transport protein n=2 Tax=Littorina saxatilis TaxID=31220 RepID=A0AAN9GAE7_9CAEN
MEMDSHHQAFFTLSTHSPLLMESWTTATPKGLAIAVASGAVLTVLLEGLKCYSFTHKLALTLFKPPSSLSIPKRLYQALLHMTEVCMAYILMVFVMSFNLFIIIAVVIGAGFGYFVLRPLFLLRVTARLRRRLRALRILYPWRNEGEDCDRGQGDDKSSNARIEDDQTDRCQGYVGNDNDGNEVWIEHSVDGVTEVKKGEINVCKPCNPMMQCRQFSVRGRETCV